MEQEPAAAEAAVPRLMRLRDPSCSSDFTAPSLSPAGFKLDEGYADETKSQSDNDCLKPSSGDAMSLPDWLLALREADKAGELDVRLEAPVKALAVTMETDGKSSWLCRIRL
jgi:F-box and WD-40 domain protein 1/11